MSILVAGGAGYIGSHTCVELLNAGYDIVVADKSGELQPGRALSRVGKNYRKIRALCGDGAVP